MKFSENEDAESFMTNRAKWHKACHLKFAPLKLEKVRVIAKRSVVVENEEEQRKSKRKRVRTPSVVYFALR